MTGRSQFIRWFDTLGVDDVPIVGGKNASLGEMYRELTPKGVKVPNGFAVTADSYLYVVEVAGILPQMRDLVSGLDKDNLDDFSHRGRALRDLVYSAPLCAG